MLQFNYMNNEWIKIDKNWGKILKDEFESPVFSKLSKFVVNEYSKKEIYPNIDDIFNAFNLCKFEDLKVVILGQDPYHGENQAMGLSFSVRKNIKLPPSLKNIFKELKSDTGISHAHTFNTGTLNTNTSKTDTNTGKTGIDIDYYGDLSKWANQGVLLLNSILTVEKSKAGSHKRIGWEEFTDSVIKIISDKKDKVVFVLWGNYAKSKASLIDTKKHLIITSTHPSPFSAHDGFFGSKPFRKINNFLNKNKLDEIDWGDIVSVEGGWD